MTSDPRLTDSPAPDATGSDRDATEIAVSGPPSPDPRDPGFEPRAASDAGIPASREGGLLDEIDRPAQSAIDPTAAASDQAQPAVETLPDVGRNGDVPSAETPRDSQASASSEVGRAPGPADRDLVVSMADVSRRFGDREVVRNINLTVPKGTILGIIGPSGAGKTTTIRMLTGGLEPTSGEVRVLGRPPKRFRRADREQIGYMPQLFTLYGDLTAGENVDFVASLFGMLFRRRRRRVREVLKIVDLWDARGRVANKLSGGMQRRLELACALVHEPALVILDEPTAGIDPLLRGTIWEELHRLRDAGTTLLVTTQHVAEAEECDSVAMIVGGEIIALAPPDELRRSATNGDLLDIQTASVFDASDLVGMEGVGEVTQDTPRHLRVVVDDAGAALPQIVERIRSKGVEVESAQEHRLSFDEIFAILVARNNREADAVGAATPGEGDESSRAAA